MIRPKNKQTKMTPRIHWQAIRAEIRDNLRIRQVALLYAASLAGIPLALVISMVFTRFLGPQGYGNFAFLESIFNFGMIIFTFGIFYAGSRAIVLNDQPERTGEYYGSTLIMLVGLFLLMAVCFTGYGLLDPNLREKGLTTFFMVLIPFGWVFLLNPFFDTVLKADNRIKALASVRFFPKVVLFAGAAGIYFLLPAFGGNRLAIVWSLYLLANVVVFLTVLTRIRISFSHWSQRIPEIWRHTRRFGLHIYSGGLFYAGSLALTGILISYFSPDNTGVGYMALAIAISRPLELVPSAVATAYFRDFAAQAALPKRLAAVTLLLSLTGLAAIWLLIGPFIRVFYSADFLPVVQLVFPVSAGMMLHGLSGLLNRYLEAQGRGKAIRNTYIITGLTLVSANLLLIPTHGTTGAAFALFLSGVVYLAVMTGYYWRRPL